MGLWHLKTRLLILGGVHCSFYCHPILSSSQTPFPLAKGVKASNLVFKKVPETCACVQLFQGAALIAVVLRCIVCSMGTLRFKFSLLDHGLLFLVNVFPIGMLMSQGIHCRAKQSSIY